MLNLFYITNRPDVALIAEKYGVDRIFVDLETLGKEERQRGMNTVKSDHKVSDIAAIKPLLTKAELLVRVNPWNPGSEKEIEDVLAAGADIIMLPMWKTLEEVQSFLACVNHRAKTTLLLETKEALEIVDSVLALPPEDRPDEIHVGINDLAISRGLTFLFENVADRTVEKLCAKFKAAGIPYGFGGIARLSKGLVPAEKIIMEHYRVGSTRAILSRSFCDIHKCQDVAEVERRFRDHLEPIRAYERLCAQASPEELEENFLSGCEVVEEIVRKMKEERE